MYKSVMSKFYEGVEMTGINKVGNQFPL